MARDVHYRPSMRISFESTLCFGLADPTTVLIVEVFLKYKRRIFLTNRRGEFVDFYETSSESHACFDSPRLSNCNLRDQIRVWVPGLSESLRTQLSQRILEYAQQVAVANDNGAGGANKVTAFVEIEEPQLQPTDNDDQVQGYTGVRADFSDDGIVLYCNIDENGYDDDDEGEGDYNRCDYDDDGDDDDEDDDDEGDDDDDDESSKPPRGLSCEEINGLKHERFKNGIDEEEESLMCSICLEEFWAGVKITPLPCSHTFHHNCIASWLEKQGSCPFCRFDITQQ